MKLIRTCAALAAILCGTQAAADVTAQQVWDNWTNQMAIYGQGFSTTGEGMSGDTLTISGVLIEMEDDDLSIKAEVGDIALTENGDGTVSITLPESYPITIMSTPEFGDPAGANLTVTQTAGSIVVSGDPDAMVYDLSMDVYGFNVDSLEGAANTEIDLEAAIVLRDLSVQYSIREDTLTRINYAMSVGAFDLDLAFSEAGGESMMEAFADIADMTFFADISIPIDMDLGAEQPPFADGLAFDGGYSFGGLTYDFDFDLNGEQASGTIAAAGGSLDIAMDMDGANYTTQTTGTDVTLMLPEALPFPIEATLAGIGVDIAVPLSQGEGGPRDARFAFNITELDVDPLIWNLFDPAEILPRGPVTLALGLDAQVTPFFDVLDPNQQQALFMTDVPGELNSADITELTISGVGAEITGDGAFTFDNSDLETFDGFPRPEGQVDFAINGVNALIDNLIALGLIPQEEAMMPRMMMGMFTTPIGDDMLTSTIEVNGEGHVLANGQRLR